MLSRLITRCVVYVRAIHAESGATAVEYALMVMLIALVIIGAVTALGISLKPIFTNAANGI
jgi:pilus assembly protein Flp/PilA